jgi:WD40 repeat protein
LIDLLTRRQCRFSNGGQMFAAVYSNTIQVFNTWTFENTANLKGHNGKVRSLSWSNDDSHLISCGSDGAVYCWSISTLKRENENILKGCSYSSAVCTPDLKSMFAVGNDRYLKVNLWWLFYLHQEIRDSQVTREISSDVMFTQVAVSWNNSMLFVGAYRIDAFGFLTRHRNRHWNRTRLQVSADGTRRNGGISRSRCSCRQVAHIF